MTGPGGTQGWGGLVAPGLGRGGAALLWTQQLKWQQGVQPSLSPQAVGRTRATHSAPRHICQTSLLDLLFRNMPAPPLQIWQLLRFLAGVMALEKPLLVSAYLLMLAALLFRLCLPRVEAAIFDAFNDLDTQLFKQQLKMWAGEAGRGDGR